MKSTASPNSPPSPPPPLRWSRRIPYPYPPTLGLTEQMDCGARCIPGVCVCVRMCVGMYGYMYARMYDVCMMYV